MSQRYTVGEPRDEYIWGNGATPFFPIIDTETGQQFGDALYRYKEDAESAAATYNWDNAVRESMDRRG